MNQIHQRGRKELPITETKQSTKLGSAIRAWRHYRGLRLTELTTLAGYTQTNRGYLSKIEHGQIRHIGDEHLLRIAQALNVDPAALNNGIFPPGMEQSAPSRLRDKISLTDRLRESGLQKQTALNPSRSQSVHVSNDLIDLQTPSETEQTVEVVLQYIELEMTKHLHQLLQDVVRPKLLESLSEFSFNNEMIFPQSEPSIEFQQSTSLTNLIK